MPEPDAQLHAAMLGGLPKVALDALEEQLRQRVEAKTKGQGMKKVKTRHVETADTAFMIEIYEAPGGGYRGEYFGSKPKFAQVMQQPGGALPLMEHVPGGRVQDADPDGVFKKACTEIEERYGKIVQVLP